MRDRIRVLIESNRFQYSIIALIVINAIILGLETSETVMSHIGPALKLIDGLILKIFIIELMLRFYVQRLGFFIRPWSVFDLVVVGIALIPATGALAALRALRVLRVLRLISTIPTMRRVIEGLITAIPGIASVAAIMSLLFYVFSVIGTHLYSATFPQWFGSLGSTMYTLFQIMTLESWSMGIVRPVMEQHPSAWMFFVTYILVTTFVMLNLFIAIIVNAMHSDIEEEAEESRHEMLDTLSRDLKEMEVRLMAEIRKGQGGA
ncbi:MAG: voltage-gated sodium channel [Hyphomicrobiales bacterium]|nr:MAG: voltage-gated sodium channel [Hyphomicrobiales bacterium]